MMREMLDFARVHGYIPSHWNVKRAFMMGQSKKDPLEYWVDSTFSGLVQKFNIYRFRYDYFPVELDCGGTIIYLRRDGTMEKQLENK